MSFLDLSSCCLFLSQDENKDGIFTVEELINWIETNQLVKYVDEGRDAEMDKIMESSHSSETTTNTKDTTNESASTATATAAASASAESSNK